METSELTKAHRLTKGGLSREAVGTGDGGQECIIGESVGKGCRGFLPTAN